MRQPQRGLCSGCRPRLWIRPCPFWPTPPRKLTFAADSTDDFELDERKERDEISEAMEERVKKYQELMREAGSAQELNALRDAIRARQGKEHALRQARQHFPDPADAWAALKQLREELSGDASANAETLRGVDEALAELEASDGPAIRAGINGALNARGFEQLGDALRTGRALPRRLSANLPTSTLCLRTFRKNSAATSRQRWIFCTRRWPATWPATRPAWKKAILSTSTPGSGAAPAAKRAQSLREDAGALA